MRKQINNAEVILASEQILNHTESVLIEKGRGTFSSVHEILGVLEDKKSELLEAIQQKEEIDVIKDELLDIAEICLFGIACINSGTLDW